MDSRYAREEVLFEIHAWIIMHKGHQNNVPGMYYVGLPKS